MEEYLTTHGDDEVEAAYFVLMTKEVIPESLGKSYAVQQGLVTAKPGYTVPNLLPAAVSIIVNYVKTGIRLYDSNYTRCLEQVYGHPAVFGDFTRKAPPLTTISISLTTTILALRLL